MEPVALTATPCHASASAKLGLGGTVVRESPCSTYRRVFLLAAAPSHLPPSLAPLPDSPRSKLDHPNVVRLIGASLSPPFLVLEYMPRGSVQAVRYPLRAPTSCMAESLLIVLRREGTLSQKWLRSCTQSAH